MENLSRFGKTAGSLWADCTHLTIKVRIVPRDVWLECPRALQKCAADDTTFREVFERLREKLNENTFQLFTTVARLIWFKRNNLIHEGNFLAPTAVLKQAYEQIATFEKARACQTNSTTPTGSSHRVDRWTKPPENVMKVNWDASVSRELNLTGVGVIVRNHEGTVQASFCTYKEVTMEPSSAESMAMWYEREVCRKLGAQNIILEGDALEVDHTLQRDSFWRGSYCMFIEEAKRNLHMFPGWSVHDVVRQANVTAHNLAQLAISLRKEKMWI
ncbi:uncharacterized protein LOC132177991 [Corylus avellana]|uniref:uncharacterized protein LOC132177991 n=1 Tax=Corylus avellana TaxID=13451 RepID=UPI00286B917E|nr:uncharacterized protein LOC132177991 [Corylus avellana]